MPKQTDVLSPPSWGTARPHIKKQAPRLLINPIIAHDNSIIAVTLKVAGFVQHRFHCSPVGRNETLVIVGSQSNYSDWVFFIVRILQLMA
jgi:hypothetical protein